MSQKSETPKMSPEDFKEQLAAAKTMGDGDEIVAQLKDDQLKRLLKALRIVDAYCGVTMRDTYIMAQMQAELEKRVREQERMALLAQEALLA